MPGENCSIPECGVCRGREAYKGIAIFQIPKIIEGDTAQNEWRSKFLAKIGREVDSGFRDQIAKNNVYACERHFDPDDYKVCKYYCFCFYFCDRMRVDIFLTVCLGGVSMSVCVCVCFCVCVCVSEFVNVDVSGCVSVCALCVCLNIFRGFVSEVRNM